MEKTKSILQKNLFPPDLIDKVVRNYLNDQYNSKESQKKKRRMLFQTTICRIFFPDTLTTKQKKLLKNCVKIKSVLILFLYHIKLVVCFSP